MKKRAIIFLLSLLKATMLYDSYSSFASKPPHAPEGAEAPISSMPCEGAEAPISSTP